jgi:hypothetical protein
MDEKPSALPLLPGEAIEYFHDANQLGKDYLKAVSIRNCLEAITDTVFVHIAAKEGSASRWNRKKLVQKIDSLKDFFPDHVLEAVHRIRKITNKGAHQAGHKDLDARQLQVVLSDLTRVCEWVVSSYLQKYGFHTESWTPTVLSALQPCYRVRILEELFSYTVNLIEDREDLLLYQREVQDWHARVMEGDFSVLGQGKETNLRSFLYQQMLLVIDKLAMAYLKDLRYTKSIEFIESCAKNSLINACFMEQMMDKLRALQSGIDELPISTSMARQERYWKRSFLQ